MERYKNLNGDSGIREYEIGSDFIKVKFNDGSIYKYTNSSAGISNIKTMSRLAVAGKGLNSFIMTNVKYDYASKN